MVVFEGLGVQKTPMRPAGGDYGTRYTVERPPLMLEIQPLDLCVHVCPFVLPQPVRKYVASGVTACVKLDVETIRVNFGAVRHGENRLKANPFLT